MVHRLNEFSISQKDLVDKSRTKVDSYQDEINTRNTEIRKLNMIISNKENELKQTNVAESLASMKVDEKEKCLSTQEREIADLKQKLADAERANDLLRQDKRSEGTVMLELEHFKADNARLINLLEKQGGSKEFAQFAQDHKGPVRYLAGPKTYGKAECQEPEENSWIPQEAFEIAHSYRDQHGDALSEAMIEKMLRELNKVWRDRERRQIARVKLQCNTEIKDLRRQITMQAPVSETNQTRQITRLKDQLKEAKKDLRNNVAKRKEDSNRPEITDHIKEALDTAGKFQDERRKMWQENKVLKQRVQDMERLVKDEEADKSKFMDGASWMARKAIVESQTTQQRLDEMVKDFDSKKRESEVHGNSIYGSSASQEQLTCEMKDMLLRSKQNLEGMLQTTTYNQTKADRKIADLGREY